MIDVSVRKGKISISGHAGYNAVGTDIVCASVCVLFQTLVMSILDHTQDKIDYRLESGNMEMKYKNLTKKSTHFVDSFFTGIVAVASVYPDYVRII